MWHESGNRRFFSWTGPLEALPEQYAPGTYYVGLDTRQESEGITGPYTLLAAVDDEDTVVSNS